jgi:hypothetical protein
MTGFINRLFGKGKGGPATETGGETGDGIPVCIMSGKEDSLPDHIDRIQASGGIPPERSYRGLYLYAIRVSGTASFLSHFQTIVQGAVRAAATGDFQGTVLELTPSYGRPVPRKMLLRILGVVSYEVKRREGDLVTFTPGPPGPDIIIAFALQGDPALPEGEMTADPAMAGVLGSALGGGGRLPSESAHSTISGMCRPDTSLAHLVRLVGMISESLRGEGITEPNILEFMRAYLSGTCPSCHRVYTGEEIVLLWGLKHSRKVQETTRMRSPDRPAERIPGEEMDADWLLNRLNRGICLNPSCKSGRVDLSWVRRSSP